MIGIVTDSTADIPKELVKEHEITVVPLQVIFGKEKFLDGIDLTPGEFYQKLRQADKLPTTAQPSPGAFEVVYKKVAETCESIISIHISEKMSGTIRSAQLAKASLPDLDITIVDSGYVHSPLGLMAIEASKMAKKGGTKEGILQLIEKFKRNFGILFLVETLEYLKMGGRIGGAKGLLASMLKIQPILTIKEGQVDAFKSVRGWNKAKQVVLDTMAETLKTDGKAVIFVGHSDSPQEAEELAERCRERFAPKELNIWEIGSVVGTHAGPGTLAAVYFNEFRQND